tara:strand:+ start:217 stop:738 length:522 start_codon:yes stop_codon:yes gene_type:complete
MKSAYVIGAPGTGKSTMMRSWLGEGLPIVGLGFACTQHHGGVLQLGASHPTFPGTDRLSMGVMPKALDLVASSPAPFVIGEGDRLASLKFLQALSDASSSFTLIYAQCPPDVAEERREARGGRQSKSWIKGRDTKSRRLALAWAVEGGKTIVINTHNGTPEMTDVLPGWPSER